MIQNIPISHAAPSLNHSRTVFNRFLRNIPNLELMNYTLENDIPDTQLFGFAISELINQLASEQMEHYADAMPFLNRWECNTYIYQGCIILSMKDLKGSGVPLVGTIKNQTFLNQARKLINEKTFPSIQDIESYIPSKNYDYSTFIYIGEYKDKKYSRTHLAQIVVTWLNKYVLPEIRKNNSRRVLDVIPPPPQYDTQELLANVFVLESETEFHQGTCFHLKGVGLITCEHVICKDTKVFNPKNPTKKVNVEVLAKHEAIDLAILKADGFDIGEGIEKGSADNINQMDHIAVMGFPNYRIGDSGIFTAGLAIGFRTVSSIRRILVNTPLIAGNSGGPAIDSSGKVIGVVVTGADRMETSNETENHGIVPIDAISFLQ